MKPLQSSFLDYASFAVALQHTCVISDPWVEGEERFRIKPIVLESSVYAKLKHAAEDIGRLYDEISAIVWSRPALLDEFFHLTPYQKLMWLSSSGRWHGIARLDLFLLADGRIQMCEMNSDTPSGEAETVLLNDLCFRHLLDTSGVRNPNQGFAERFCAMVWSSYQASVREPQSQPTIGIVYPTEMPEDLSMIVLYREWLRQAGFIIVAGSPYNLHSMANARVGMFDTPLDIILRHYKTDWWGERLPVWRDADDFPDPAPLDRELRVLIGAELAGMVTVVNPLGAVLTQNKLTMAFVWQHINLFSEQAQTNIRRYVPETQRLCDSNILVIQSAKNEWVLKSDYGCEGDEVIIGRFATQEQWEVCLAMAVPERWIVQRFFEVMPEEVKSGNEGTSNQQLLPNYGVYLVGGSASGIYTRLARVATDYRAISAPTFIL